MVHGLLVQGERSRDQQSRLWPLLMSPLITVRQAFDESYVRYAHDLEPTTVRKMRHDFNRWSKHTPNPPIGQIKTDTFVDFRQRCLSVPLSPDTIETTIGSVMTVLAHCANGAGLLETCPHPGRRLKRTKKMRHVHTPAEISAVYQQRHCAQWPKRLNASPAEFWAAYIAVEWFTAVRREDSILRVLWQWITEQAIGLPAHKSGKLQLFPRHPVLNRHLALMERDQDTDGRVFPVGKSYHQLRRELLRMSVKAGVRPHVTPQALRRAASTAWEAAKDGAGKLILGHSQGVSDRYLSVPRLLREAVELLEIPEAMLTPAEVDQQRAQEELLIRNFRRMKPASRAATLAFVKDLALG